MGSHQKIFYNAPPIGSVESLAKTLSFTPAYLKAVAKDAAAYYTVFTKPVKSKLRTLSEPRPALKTLQKRVVSRMFCHLEFPPYLHGGIKTDDPRDFITNASAHRNAETAITLDVESFFPSISVGQVTHAFKNLFHFPDDVAEILAKILTLNGSVPQGAPTSSYIANFVMWEKEWKLVSGFKSRSLEYTRLIDDMTISSAKRLPEKDITRIMSEVSSMLRGYNYKMHPKKKNIFSRSNPEHLMQITGLWLNRGAPKLLKARRIDISREVIEVRRMAEQPNMIYHKDFHTKHAAAFGRVMILQRLNHSRSDRLRRILEGSRPVFDIVTCSKISALVRRFCGRRLEKQTLGYIRTFYNLQHSVAIIKRTDPVLAKDLQAKLNSRRPTATLRKLYA